MIYSLNFDYELKIPLLRPKITAFKTKNNHFLGQKSGPVEVKIASITIVIQISDFY